MEILFVMKVIKIRDVINSPYLHSVGNKFLCSVLAFLSNALFTRSLGLQLKGEYTWYINYASIISIILGLGVYHSMPYFMRNNSQKAWGQEYINIYYVQMYLYLIILGVVLILVPEKKKLFIIGILAIVDILSQQLSMLLLIDKLHTKNKIYLFGVFINFLVSIVCYMFIKKNLFFVIGCYIVIKVLYIILYTRGARLTPHPTKVKIRHIVEKIKFGYLPMLSFLLITANYKIDILMLPEYVSANQLSLYSTGVTIAEMGWLIPDVFKEVLFSRISQSKNDKEVESAIRISNLIILLFIVGIIILGKSIIYIFFGIDFMPAYQVTILLFLGIPAMSWFKMIYQLFNAEGKRKTSFVILFVSTVINIGANYLLIPIWGIYGAAIASVISYTVCGIIFLGLYARHINVKVFALFIPRRNDFGILFKISKNIN